MEICFSFSPHRKMHLCTLILCTFLSSLHILSYLRRSTKWLAPFCTSMPLFRLTSPGWSELLTASNVMSPAWKLAIKSNSCNKMACPATMAGYTPASTTSSTLPSGTPTVCSTPSTASRPLCPESMRHPLPP